MGPDGLLPQLAKNKDCPGSGHPSCQPDDGGGEGGDPSYTVTHAVSFLTVIDGPITDGRSGGKKGTAVSIGHALDRKPIVLSGDFLGLLPGPTQLCFRTDMVPIGLSAQFRARKGYVEGQYYFQAYGTDGLTPVLYSFDLTGNADGGDVAPGPEDGITTIDWDPDGIFFRQGDVPACVGDGPQGRWNVTITQMESITIEGN